MFSVDCSKLFLGASSQPFWLLSLFIVVVCVALLLGRQLVLSFFSLFEEYLCFWLAVRMFLACWFWLSKLAHFGN